MAIRHHPTGAGFHLSEAWTSVLALVFGIALLLGVAVLASAVTPWS